MKQLLENDFLTYNYAPGPHRVNHCILPKGIWKFLDNKSCRDCKSIFYRNCGHCTFKLNTNAVVEVICIEEFLNTFKKLAGERCDYLFYDDKKIALVDLYCGLSQYVGAHLRDGETVPGKHSKVKDQIVQTLDTLYAVPSIAAYIDSKTEKYGIFGCRLKDDDFFKPLPQQISDSKDMFMGMADYLSSISLLSTLPHNFKYITVKYSKEYEW